MADSSTNNSIEEPRDPPALPEGESCHFIGGHPQTLRENPIEQGQYRLLQKRQKFRNRLLDVLLLYITFDTLILISPNRHT